MSYRIGVVMDPIQTINPAKDTTFALMLEARRRGHQLFYLEPRDIWLHAGLTWGNLQAIDVRDQSSDFFTLLHAQVEPLVELDLLLLRKDPPFDMNYIYLTYLLEHAHAKGLRVINNPISVRNANEKLFTAWFPQCCPNTLVSSDPQRLHEFAQHEKDVVLKPLGSMGGEAIFHLTAQDPNLNVAIELLTQKGQHPIMAQRFIPEISDGDKRILMINGEPVPYALARIPAKNDFRGNLAKGASYEGRELTERDQWICEQVGPTLRALGLTFVGLDVIGDYLTEINVTSPTCARQLDSLFTLNIAGQFWDYVEAHE